MISEILNTVGAACQMVAGLAGLILVVIAAKR